MNNQVALWVGFNLFVVAMLAVDLFVTGRKSHAVTPKEAGVWTGVWVTISLLFCGGIYVFSGAEKSLQFLTGYLIEYSLSVDNLFVFLMVFGYFRVPPQYQHKLLFWGVLGAFMMRAALILLGTALVSRFHWVLYIFGAFLLYTAVRMALSRDSEADPEHSPVLKLARRLLPISRGAHGAKFMVREEGQLRFTPLFLVLLVVETTDLVFALDSIPAVLGVSQDPFILYSSNVCAILGLRSLFFVVASLMDKFHFLKFGLAAVLGFVGLKMVLEPWIQVPIAVSLAVIASILAISITLSALRPVRPPPP